MALSIGYARVSTHDQDPQLQLDALDAAGCQRVWTDHASGKSADRAGLTAALAHLREGDVLVVWRLDRLGRSLVDLINIVRDLDARGVGFRSLSDGIDTTTNGGKLVFHIMGALAEYERDLIRERTAAGLAVARRAGRTGGQPHRLSDADLDTLVREWEHRTPDDLAKAFGVSRATIYRSHARAVARATVDA
jgi:DNA invertase Pin-like site-specific DNA recombinase